ncbi:MAG: hypothetical protein ABIJ21_05730 [Nanoarchaeota archaeon]
MKEHKGAVSLTSIIFYAILAIVLAGIIVLLITHGKSLAADFVRKLW